MSSYPENIQFEIDHIDPLGQGVFKKNGEIYFLAKTLVGEKGRAKIFKKSKGVHFGLLESEKDLSQISPDRIPSPCPHYSQCLGCQFLHTSYENELTIKREALVKHLSFLHRDFDFQDIPITVVPSTQRFSYRNRVQLHYNLQKKKLGMINASTHQIVEIPSCLLPIPEIKKAIDSLYHQQTWIELAKKQRPLTNQGHIEIYLPPNSENAEKKAPLISWNRPYAETGFSQVHQELNTTLKAFLHRSFSELQHNYRPDSPPLILDLFGGNGNLGKDLLPSESWVIDLQVPLDELRPHQKGLSLNLFEKSSLQNFQKNLAKTSSSPTVADFFLVDPPRKGFSLLADWASTFQPNFIFYISCFPSTLVRDIKNLKSQYRITQLFLFDFFPSTYHFETMVLLQKT